MHRTEFLNRLIKTFDYRTYLEIGVDQGACLAAIEAAVKVGVDPNPSVRQLQLPRTMLYCGSSDDFFGAHHAPAFFDLAFIDGWHVHEQVYRDVIHCLQALSARGTIVLHDCNPTTEPMQRVPRVQGEWTGDCWKAIARLRMTHDDLRVSVLDTDYGLGVVRRGSSTPLAYGKPWNELTWADLEADRQRLLGIVPLSLADDFFSAP